MFSWAQLVSFLNCLPDVKLSRIAIYRDEFRRMNCSLNWSFISCGELHCDSVKIKTMIKSSLFFLRQCESLDWFGCFVIVGYSFPEERCVSHFYSVFGQAFSLLPPRPLPAAFDSPISSSLREVSTWHFREQIARSKETPALQACFTSVVRKADTVGSSSAKVTWGQAQFQQFSYENQRAWS